MTRPKRPRGAATPARRSARASPAPSPTPTPPKASTAAVRVYIVEDEALIALELRDRLTSLGYEVTGQAGRGAQAIKEIALRPPDLVLMDIRLVGKLDGIETAARLRAEHDLPVVFLTAYSDPEVLRQAVETEPYGYLIKPVEERELHATIQMALYKHKMEARLKAANERLEEQVRARTADLARSQARLEFILTKSPVVVYTGRVEGDFGATFVSDNVRSQLGYEPEEFVSDSGFWASHIHPDDAPKVFAGLPLLFERGAHVHEYRFLRRDGAYRWMRDELRLIRDEAGAPLEIVGGWIDISGRKTAEDALRKSEQSLAITLNSIGDGVISTDAAGHVVHLNPVAETLTGWATAEAAGHPIEEVFTIVDERTGQPAVNPVAETLALGTVQGLANHTALIARDGTQRSIADSCAPMRDAEDRIIGAVMVFRDVTQEHATRRALLESEQSLRRLNETLEGRVAEQTHEVRESEKRLTHALDATAEGLWDWDIETGRVHYSPQWARLLGFEPEEVPKRVEFFFSVTHPDDGEGVKRALEEHLAGRAPIKETEVRLRLKSGGYRWFLDRGKVVAWDEAGTPTRMVGTINDIENRKRANETLQASLRDKEALLKEVHHRVKNNLQVVTSLLRLEGDRAQDAPTRSVLTAMQNRIYSMALMHETLYRSDTFAAVDLGDYLRQVATQTFHLLAASPTTIGLRLELSSWPVAMDQALPCGLIVAELVSNALKHGFPNGNRGEVLVELSQGHLGAEPSLTVSDTGVGLPANFESKRALSLGLQLVADLTEQLEGTLEIGPGPGAAFTIRFGANQEEG